MEMKQELPDDHDLALDNMNNEDAEGSYGFASLSHQNGENELLWFCMICNSPCLMAGGASGGNDIKIHDHQQSNEFKEIILQAFDISSDSSKASINVDDGVPLCSKCVLKCGQLKYINLQMQQLEIEYSRIREEMAFSIVDLVASNTHLHSNYFDDKDPFYELRKTRQLEIEAMQQFIFENWHEGCPSPVEPATSSRMRIRDPSPKKNTIPKKIQKSNLQLGNSNAFKQLAPNGKGSVISVKTIPSSDEPSTSAGIRRRETVDSEENNRPASNLQIKTQQVQKKKANNISFASTSNKNYQDERNNFNEDPLYNDSPHGNADYDDGSNDVDNEWGHDQNYDASLNESQEEMMMKYDYFSSSGHFMEGGFDEDPLDQNIDDDSNLDDQNEIDYNQNAEGLYVCTYCSKQFIHKYPYRDHLKTHTGEGPRCPVCGKIFPKNHNLMLHMRTHTGEKPFKCEICRKGFADKSNLKVHMRTHTGERPYRCDACGLSFVNSSRLVVHKRLHTGEKPFPCDLCGKRFGTSNQFQAHRKTHFGGPSAVKVDGRKLPRRPKLM